MSTICDNRNGTMRRPQVDQLKCNHLRFQSQIAISLSNALTEPKAAFRPVRLSAALVSLKSSKSGQIKCPESDRIECQAGQRDHISKGQDAGHAHGQLNLVGVYLDFAFLLP